MTPAELAACEAAYKALNLDGAEIGPATVYAIADACRVAIVGDVDMRAWSTADIAALNADAAFKALCFAFGKMGEAMAASVKEATR